MSENSTVWDCRVVGRVPIVVSMLVLCVCVLCPSDDRVGGRPDKRRSSLSVACCLSAYGTVCGRYTLVYGLYRRYVT